MARRRVITLTTDFGLDDHYIGAVKGVILNINPDVSIVDLNLQVKSYDVFEGAFTLARSYGFFPPATVHLVIVDPGVGTARRPLVVSAGNYKFVAPDNGVLSFIYESEPEPVVRHVTSEHYFLRPVSQTFHGRDIFGPVAAWLSRGVEADKFGEVITDYVRFVTPKPRAEGNHTLKGVTLKVDKFGNLITNFTPADVPQLFTTPHSPFKAVVNQKEITEVKKSYLDGAPSELFFIAGSSGYLEISTNRGSASELLHARRGTEVSIMLGAAPPQG